MSDFYTKDPWLSKDTVFCTILCMVAAVIILVAGYRRIESQPPP